VHLEWLRLAPYPSRPDPARADRLAEIVDTADGTWIVVDGEGERHVVDEVKLRVLVADLATPTWVVHRPIPTYGVGEQVILGWRTRGRGYPEERRPDRVATVVEEDAPTVTALDDVGERHRINRINGHELTDRRSARWAIVGHPLVRPVPILRHQYLRDHHDVPRIVELAVDERRLVLECPFDEARGGFLPSYDVYEVAGASRRRLGRVLVDAVHFDESHRRLVDVASLPLGAGA
jgi:hypothetical protein